MGKCLMTVCAFWRMTAVRTVATGRHERLRQNVSASVAVQTDDASRSRP